LQLGLWEEKLIIVVLGAYTEEMPGLEQAGCVRVLGRIHMKPQMDDIYKE